MTPAPPIGATLIGGFLGAGKTTLVNHLLRRTPGRRIGVLVNDFGDINIDAELIATHEGEAIRLSNGCLCCGLGDDLGRALIGVLAQTRPPEHLLIEASGVAEPWRIAELLRAIPEFRRGATLVVVDAARIFEQAADRHVGDLARSQLDSADVLILNRTDRLDAARRDRAADWLRAGWPGREIVATAWGAVDPTLLDRPPHSGGRGLGPRQGDAARRFIGLRFVAPGEFDRATLAATLSAMPGWVLRLKGIVALAGEATPQILQFTRSGWSTTAHDRPGKASANRVVAIALRDRADPARFTRLLSRALIDGRARGAPAPKAEPDAEPGRGGR